MMERIRLGQSDLWVSRLGLGGCPLGGHGWGRVEDEQSLRAVRAAWNAGVNFFDTADVYGFGHSEEILCRALGKKRHDAVIATKFGVRWDRGGKIVKDISADYLQVALEASLRRLHLECIPVYYVHWPDGKTPIESIVEALVRCREQGKIKAIGVSNFSEQQIRSAKAVGEIACVQAQVSLVDRQALALNPVLRESQSTLVTWGSLAQGLLSGKYGADSSFDENDRRSRYENFRGERFQQNLATVRVLKDIALRLGKTPAQVAIRWLLDTEVVGSVLFGAKTGAQVSENVGASGWTLTCEEYHELANSLRYQAA